MPQYNSHILLHKTKCARNEQSQRQTGTGCMSNLGDELGAGVWDAHLLQTNQFSRQEMRWAAPICSSAGGHLTQQRQINQQGALVSQPALHAGSHALLSTQPALASSETPPPRFWGTVGTVSPPVRVTAGRGCHTNPSADTGTDELL